MGRLVPVRCPYLCTRAVESMGIWSDLRTKCNIRTLTFLLEMSGTS